jgi:hypothetical protein
MDKIGNGGIFGISKGAGYQVINKFGENSDIDVADTPIEIWSHGADGTNFPFLDTGIPMDIVSTSASDDLVGTGAQKAKVTFYQTDNTEISQVYDLDGVTPVQINNDVKICTRIEIVQTGSSNTNVGEINIVDRATGLIVYQSVEIGEGQTLSAIQVCPKDKKGLVKSHYVTYSRSQTPFATAQMRLRKRGIDGTITTKYNVTLSTNNVLDRNVYEIGGIAVEEGEIIFWECLTVSADSTPIGGGFDMEFENG